MSEFYIVKKISTKEIILLKEREEIVIEGDFEEEILNDIIEENTLINDEILKEITKKW